ncbi:MAG: methyltransferase domain-containing protein [Proteobacteria bacterium]|nr:methyltransferase domain-containing protein [Pseudomonadota bacterium]
MDLDAIKSAYGRYARHYDTFFGNLVKPGRRATLAAANRIAGRRILEVGVGTGLSLPEYRPDCRVVGIDISAEMLAIARRRVERLKLGHVEALLEMDAENLTFRDAAFDVVVALYTASVVPNPQRLLREMRRVCVPGGDILICNHFAARRGVRAAIEKAMAPFSGRLGWHPDFNLDSFIDPDEIHVRGMRTVNPFGLFTVIHCRNEKPNGVRAAAHAGYGEAPSRRPVSKEPAKGLG